MKTNSILSQEDISKRAHEIWEQSGRLEGKEIDNWLQAEQELQAERQQTEPPTDVSQDSAAPFPEQENVRSKELRRSTKTKTYN